MNKEDKLFKLITKMYGEMQDGFKEVRDRLDKVENEVVKTNMAIEHDIKPKVNILFDGYKQYAEKLTRIEEEVSKHEEIILKGLDKELSKWPIVCT